MSKQVMQQALKCIKDNVRMDVTNVEYIGLTVSRLREAIKACDDQSLANTQEPVAWIPDLELMKEFPDTRTVTLYPMQMKYTSPLYTHPQRRLKRLSEDEVLALAHRICKRYTHNGDEPYSFDDGCMTHFANAIMDKMMEENNE